MTCKDCIHYKACDDSYNFVDEKDIAKICLEFEDKSHFIELPCKIGDTIYFETYKRGDSIGIQPHKVANIKVVVTTEKTTGSVGAEIPDWEFGKTVFLTREQAEKALERKAK